MRVKRVLEPATAVERSGLGREVADRDVELVDVLDEGDDETDGALVESMRAGVEMTVRGTSARGTDTTDTYSLSGVTAAMGEIDKACA